IGAHPDATAPLLQRLWELEERARASGLPALVLRLAPLVGPSSPLWLRLAAGGELPGRLRPLLNPVVEEDAVLTLERACAGAVPRGGDGERQAARARGPERRPHPGAARNRRPPGRGARVGEGRSARDPPRGGRGAGARRPRSPDRDRRDRRGAARPDPRDPGAAGRARTAGVRRAG